MKSCASKARIARLIGECDRLWRRIILLRADCRCEICGAKGPFENDEIVWVQACHIISRTYWSTRWHPRNGIAGCQDCHDHKIIMEWLERTDPARYLWIMEQKRRHVPHKNIDLKKILRKLRVAA